MLTLEKLKAMKPGMFANGIVENSPEGIFMTRSDIGRKLIWAAVRGEIYDWSIYVHWEDSGLAHVISNGDKVTDPKNVQKLVPCDVEAMEMYRN